MKVQIEFEIENGCVLIGNRFHNMTTLREMVLAVIKHNLSDGSVHVANTLLTILGRVGQEKRIS